MDNFIDNTVAKLKEQIGDKKVILGLSGGVDSSYLLYAAKKCGADIKPYYVKGPFQAEFELQDAVAIARFTGAENMTILHVNALEDEKVTANDPMRCYHCKCKCYCGIGKLLGC